MKVKEARGESWKSLEGEIRYLPLFEEKEISVVESIVKSLEGMDLESSFELLERVKKYLLQAVQVNSH